jgi:hypothetical protein
MTSINFVERRVIVGKFWYTIDLGNSPLKKHYFHKAIAWPVYAWKAILPTVLTDELDILQKLILSLARINKLNDPTILYQLGISIDLVQAVKQSCMDKEYLNSDNTLTESGKQLLSNSLSVEQNMMMNYEQMYIFRDALTGDIIPNFQVKELPREERKEYDYVLEENVNFKNQKPTFIDIGRALRVRKQLNRLAETLQSDYASEVLEPEQLSSFDDFELQIEDVDWELINDEGELEITTMAEKEEAEEKEKRESVGQTTMKIISQKPEVLYLDATLYVDPDLPERVAVSSPFGHYEDDWLTKHLLMHSQKSDCVKEYVEFFMEEAKEELMDQFPFNNHLDIELFKKYPIIANYEEWKPLRNQIEATTRAYNRLVQGHEDYDTFYMRAQRTLEGVLKYSILQIPNKQEIMKPVSKFSFTDSVKQIGEELGVHIPTNLSSPDFYGRLKNVARDRGLSSKDRALFLAFDAYYNKEESPSLSLLKTIPDFYKRINLITNIRNHSTHFNEENLDSQHFEDIKQHLDFLIDSLIAHYLIPRR